VSKEEEGWVWNTRVRGGFGGDEGIALVGLSEDVDGWFVGLEVLEFFIMELEFLRRALNFRLDGVVRAAWADRWRVTLLIPMRMLS